MSDEVQRDRTARDLLDAGREGPRPSELAVERIRRAVALELGRSGGERAKIGVTAKLLVAAIALGGALYAAARVSASNDGNAPVKAVHQAPSLRPNAPPVAQKPLAPADDRASGLAAGIPTPSRPRGDSRAALKPPASASPAIAPSVASGARSRSDQLVEEIELLARVNSAVNAGDAGRALGSLREYDRRFGSGILREERAAASVLALCAAGRLGEARAEADRFARRWPRSPLLGRIESSCAGAK